jgi:hypothetical protein
MTRGELLMQASLYWQRAQWAWACEAPIGGAWCEDESWHLLIQWAAWGGV